MSGSGAAVFGFVKNQKEGHRIIRRLPRKKWDIFLTNTV